MQTFQVKKYRLQNFKSIWDMCIQSDKKKYMKMYMGSQCKFGF